MLAEQLRNRGSSDRGDQNDAGCPGVRRADRHGSRYVVTDDSAGGISCPCPNMFDVRVTSMRCLPVRYAS
jgi:hypothetical protein